MIRLSSWCASASALPTRSMPSGWWSRSKRRTAEALAEVARNRRIDVLRLAESLGAQTVTLDGPSVAVADRVRPASQRSRALWSASRAPGWRSWLRRSTATELVARRPRLRHLRDCARSGRRKYGKRRTRRPHPPRSTGAATGPRSPSPCSHVRRGLHVSLFRADQSCDGVSARRHDRGAAARPRAGERSPRSRTLRPSISALCRRASRSPYPICSTSSPSPSCWSWRSSSPIWWQTFAPRRGLRVPASDARRSSTR